MIPSVPPDKKHVVFWWKAKLRIPGTKNARHLYKNGNTHMIMRTWVIWVVIAMGELFQRQVQTLHLEKREVPHCEAPVSVRGNQHVVIVFVLSLGNSCDGRAP
jgi:hypothetical protein